MADRRLTRRRMIRTTGAAALVGLAGCSSESGQSTTDQPTSAEPSASPTTSTSTPAPTTTTEQSDSSNLVGPKHGDDLPKDTAPMNGYPPEFDTVPETRTVNTASFETLTRSEVEIKLVPTDVAYYWYARGEARFADARSESEYDVSHIFGAVLSPAGDGRELPDDPAPSWPKSDRIVTYCDCPHHLSSLRASSLKNQGFEEVYALDEGFSAWRDLNLPLAGADVGRVPPVRTIEGSVPTRHAGGTAWAYHVDSNQREATDIGQDGTYTLHVKFVDLTASSTIRIETPAYTLTATVEELTNGTIQSDGSLSATGGGSSTIGTTGTTDDGTQTTSRFSLRGLFR